MFQTVSVVLNIGQSIRLSSIAAMAGTIASLTVNGGHKDFLNLKGCVGLKHLKLSDLSGVNVVDISGLAVLNMLELEGCAGLAMLNASGCTELSEIRGCSELTGLVNLNIVDTKLSDLDLANSVKLEFLTIPGNMTNLRLPKLTGVSITCPGPPPTNISLPGASILPPL
jgi:hypothetical protein